MYDAEMKDDEDAAATAMMIANKAVKIVFIFVFFVWDKGLFVFEKV